IKSEDEVNEFAYLELKGLFGKVQPIKNFYDSLARTPLQLFTSEDIRVQDILTMELPYGKIQGFYGEKKEITDLTPLIKRLAYTREIFVLLNKVAEPEKMLTEIFPDGVIGKNVQFFEKDDKILFRFITHQYYLEKSQYISKLSRNEKEIDNNVETLSKHLIENYYRVPPSSTLSIGKRLVDYFTIREEPSLYLNHYMHPYKGKFHPKMVRALLNYVYPEKEGVVLDNFAGCGTLLVEANYLGLDSLGVDINPLSVLMSNVKCNSLTFPIEKLRKSIAEFMTLYENELKVLRARRSNQKVLLQSKFSIEELDKEVESVKEDIKDIRKLQKNKFLAKEILLSKMCLDIISNEEIHNFLLLSISGTISDFLRRRTAEYIDLLKERINDLFLRIYLFHRLNDLLKIDLGGTTCYVGDTRDMDMFEDNSVDGIVNSPPYSTALDYIKNDYPQLVLLNLVDSMDQLQEDMMGNPRINYDKEELSKRFHEEIDDPLGEIETGLKFVGLLLKNGRKNAGYRIYKFFTDMLYSIQEMYRVMKPGTKCAIVIGNNHFKVNDRYHEIENDEVLLEIAKKTGFKEDQVIKRELHKTSVGNIRKETILIFQK
ncbi:MAG: DNA methyltransferase, partial [Asgard group archaeon]|nr:DNA methyltransferase [Asgard group archaeon]